MTLSEVADHLKVAEKTVLRMVRRGEIPAVKVASQWRFLESAVHQWLLTAMRPAAAGPLQAPHNPGAAPVPLSRALGPACIFTGLRREARPDLLARLAAPLAADGVIGDVGAWLAAALQREDLLPTAVGGGLALPHARDPIAPAGRAGIAIGIGEALPFDPPDAEPVRVVVLVCADRLDRHLDLMAQVAAAWRDAATRRSLKDAAAPGDVMRALIEHEQRLLFRAPA